MGAHKFYCNYKLLTQNTTPAQITKIFNFWGRKFFRCRLLQKFLRISVFLPSFGVDRFNKKVDLIITPEKSQEPLLICGEVKYFHYSVEGINRGLKTAEEVIEKDLKTLLKIKELGIAEKVVFIIFDDYYYLNKSKKCKNIKNLLRKYDKKIKILYHDSRAKLR